MATGAGRDRKITHHKSQRTSPTHSVLRPHHLNNQESFSNPLLNFKKQMLSKLKVDHLSYLKLDIQPYSRKIPNYLLSQKKRINTETIGKNTLFFPELESKRKDTQLKDRVDQIKHESKRMFDEVNKLYEIIKNDFNKATLHPKIDNKKGNHSNRESSNRKRNKTSDSKPNTSNYRATIDTETVRRKSISQHMKRNSNKHLGEPVPQSGLLFTFYPNQEEVNQFLE